MFFRALNNYLKIISVILYRKNLLLSKFCLKSTKEKINLKIVLYILETLTHFFQVFMILKAKNNYLIKKSGMI